MRGAGEVEASQTSGCRAQPYTNDPGHDADSFALRTRASPAATDSRQSAKQACRTPRWCQRSGVGESQWREQHRGIEKGSASGPMVSRRGEAPQRQMYIFVLPQGSLKRCCILPRTGDQGSTPTSTSTAQLPTQFCAVVGLECRPPTPTAPERVGQSHSGALWRCSHERSWPDSREARIVARGINSCMVRLG